MRIIRFEAHGALGEVITNAYGNGYVNPKPDFISDAEWESMVHTGKQLEMNDTVP